MHVGFRLRYTAVQFIAYQEDLLLQIAPAAFFFRFLSLLPVPGPAAALFGRAFEKDIAHAHPRPEIKDDPADQPGIIDRQLAAP